MESCMDTMSIHEAASSGNLSIIKQLLRKNPGLVNAQTENQPTPLFYAVYYALPGSVDGVKCVKYLLDHGAEVNQQNFATARGATPLFMAAHFGNVKITKILLDRKADVNIADYDGITPLHMAASTNSNASTLKLLLDYKAKVNANGFMKQTPLHWATKRKDNIERVYLLLRYNAEINAKDNQEATPLYNAASMGNINTINFLLEHKAQVNIQDIQVAARNGHQEIVELLKQSMLQQCSHLIPKCPVCSRASNEVNQTSHAQTPCCGKYICRYCLDIKEKQNSKCPICRKPLRSHQSVQTFEPSAPRYDEDSDDEALQEAIRQSKAEQEQRKRENQSVVQRTNLLENNNRHQQRARCHCCCVQ